MTQLFQWRWHPPILAAADPATKAVPEWLREIWALRGEVFYDGGARPQFKIGADRFEDSDPGDFWAFHVTCHCDGKAVGCVRVLPLVGPTLGVAEQVLGTAAIERMLASLECSREKAFEGGRWVVHDSMRNRRAAQMLIAGAMLVAATAKLTIGICAVGMKRKQDAMLRRLGFNNVPGVEPVFIERFEDTIRMVYVRPSKLERYLSKLMDEMSVNLGLQNP
ncbi:MAG TPA: GNAT family N-acyltransferase [Gemmataceae bacterium]|jgi:N-acyl-L-homoserine lactone synthetase|nr:GNAT family N-acyltransferase [Gemmataceae bacterium]